MARYLEVDTESLSNFSTKHVQQSSLEGGNDISMKRIILFLGSGVSLDSDLPSVLQMRERLFKRTVLPNVQTPSNPRRTVQDRARVEDIRSIHKLLRLLEAYDKHDRKVMGLAWTGHRYASSGAIFRGPTTYEDLYALCQDVNSWSAGQSDYAVTGAFVDMIERRAGSILPQKSRKARILAIGYLAAASARYIQQVVANALAANVPVGLDLIVEALHDPAIEEVNIVTLNHDTLVEHLLAREGIPFVDGFGEQDGDVRWFDDACYDKSGARVRLLKLHGSIDWYTFAWSGRVWRPAVTGTNPAKATDHTGKSLKRDAQLPFFLCGGNKDAWYQHGLFADIHYRFHQVLRRCNRIVMSGFGWGDSGIANQIDRWFDQKADNRLVLLHRDPQELRSRSKLLAASYDGLVERRQLIPVSGWLSETSLRKIETDLWN